MPDQPAVRPRRCLLVLLSLVAPLTMLACQGESESSGPFGLGEGGETTSRPRPTATFTPGAEDRPTDTPETTATPPRPMVIEGTGDGTAPERLELRPVPYRVRTEFRGTGVFSVNLIGESGRSHRVGGGVGPAMDEGYIEGAGSYRLELLGDGPWRVEIDQIEPDPEVGVRFSGSGNLVSGLFLLAPGEQTYRITHEGTSNFIVGLECGDRRLAVVNEIGNVDGSFQVDNANDTQTCAWTVFADGSWTIRAE